MDSALLDKINFKVQQLKEVCPALIATTRDDEFQKYDISLNYQEDLVLQYQKKYFDKVEEGNRYISELNTIEEKYFTTKYGNQIWEYIKTQRELYIKRSTTPVCSSDTTLNVSELYKDLMSEYEIYSNFNKKKIDKTVTVINKNINEIESDMNQMNNQSEINKRKLEYRNVVTNKTMRYSNYVTVIYYFILICIFIFLYVKDSLNFNKNKILYIIVVLFPLLYKYCFALLVYLYNTVKNNIISSGPKNAFLNDNDNLNFLDN